METKNLHTRIDSYLASLKTDSDKLTQFYDASLIAKNALSEVDKLKKVLREVGSTKYGIHTISLMVNEALQSV